MEQVRQFPLKIPHGTHSSLYFSKISTKIYTVRLAKCFSLNGNIRELQTLRRGRLRARDFSILSIAYAKTRVILARKRDSLRVLARTSQQREQVIQFQKFNDFATGRGLKLSSIKITSLMLQVKKRTMKLCVLNIFLEYAKNF